MSLGRNSEECVQTFFCPIRHFPPRRKLKIPAKANTDTDTRPVWYVSKSVTTNSGCPLQTTPQPPSGCSLSGKSIQRASKVTHNNPRAGHVRARGRCADSQCIHLLQMVQNGYIAECCTEATLLNAFQKYPNKCVFCPVSFFKHGFIFSQS